MRKIKDGIAKRIKNVNKCQNCFISDVTQCKSCEIYEKKNCENCSHGLMTGEYVCCFHSLKKNYKSYPLIHKIEGYKDMDNYKFDKKGNITETWILEQLKSQNNRCYICLEEVLIYNFMAGCQYQYSVDRIFNDMPHDENNCLISCFYCNCRKYNRKKKNIDCKKVCEKECHVIPQELPHKKDIVLLYEPNVDTRLIW